MEKNYSKITVSLDVEYSLGTGIDINISEWLYVLDKLIYFDLNQQNVKFIYAVVGELVDVNQKSEYISSDNKSIILSKLKNCEYIGWHTNNHISENLIKINDWNLDLAMGVDLINKLFNKDISLYVPPQNLSIHSKYFDKRRKHSKVWFEKGMSWNDYATFPKKIARMLNAFFSIDNSGSFFVRFNLPKWIFKVHMKRLKNYIKSNKKDAHLWFHPFNCIGYDKNLDYLFKTIKKCVE